MKAEQIKKQSIAAKRAATSIRALLGEIEFAQRYDARLQLLTKKEIQVLEEAVRVLGGLGGNMSEKAASAKWSEEKAAAQLAQLKEKAGAIIEAWPTGTVLDRLVVIAMNGNYRLGQLEKLAGEPNNWRGEPKPASARQDEFSYEFDEAKKELASNAAWRAQNTGQAVVDVMAKVPEMQAAARTSPRILALARTWEGLLRD